MLIYTFKALEIYKIIQGEQEARKEKHDWKTGLWDSQIYIKPDYLAYKMPGVNRMQWCRNYRKYPGKDEIRMPNQELEFLVSSE